MVGNVNGRISVVVRDFRQPECVDPADAQQFRELLEQCQREGFDRKHI